MPYRRLTPRLVDTLQSEPGKTQTVWFDTDRKAPVGFALRTFASGVRTFYVLATDITTKQRVWVRLGEARGAGLAQARKTAFNIAGRVATGANPNVAAKEAKAKKLEDQAHARRESNEPLVHEVVSRYVDDREPRLSPVTAREYRRMIERTIKPSAFGQMKARMVVRSDARSFLEKLAKKASGSADYMLSLLRAAWKWARVEELEPGVPLVDQDRDPLFGLKPYKASRVRTRFLSDAEIVTFWKGVGQLKACWSHFVRFILLTGLRRGECYAARWGWVDWDAAVMHVPAEVRKGREGRREPLDVPLSPLAIKLLRELEPITGDRPRIFVGQGISSGTVGNVAKAVTGIADVTIHDLRRTCASGLQRIGAPAWVISQALGHVREAGSMPSDVAYVHGGRPGEVKVWMSRWSDHVELLLGEREAPERVVAIRA